MSRVPWLGIIALVLTVFLNAIGFTYSYAVLGQKVETLERQVLVLESKREKSDDALAKISSTLERIDERLKYVTLPSRELTSRK